MSKKRLQRQATAHLDTLAEQFSGCRFPTLRKMAQAAGKPEAEVYRWFQTVQWQHSGWEVVGTSLRSLR